MIMEERIVEIIVYLLNEMQQDRAQLEKINLTKELLSKGYTDNEINLGFSWICNRSSISPLRKKYDINNYNEDDDHSVSIDKIVISPDAYGYLIHLIKLGVLNDNDVELLAESALSFGKSNIDVEDLKSIVASIIFKIDRNTPFTDTEINRGDIPIQ